MTCLNRVREGITRQSIWPLTGRVGKARGGIWPDQAPAQFTTLPARNVVLAVVTPVTRLSYKFKAVTASPEEKSTA